MDEEKKDLIERFAQAVSCHGPNLTHATALAQVTEDGGLFDFLSPGCTNVVAASFYRNKLQMLHGESTRPSNIAFSLDKTLHHDVNSHSLLLSNEPAHHVSNDEKFMCDIQQFLAAKADVIFQMKGHELARREAQYGVDSSYAVLAKYGETPPLESFMEIPAHFRRQELFKVLSIGDIVIGEVVSKRPFGIFVKLKSLEFGVNRDFSDVDIQAICRTAELEVVSGSKEFHDPIDAFVVGDLVRGVICGVSSEEQKVSISFRPSKVSPKHSSVQLGIIEDPELVIKRAARHEEGASFNHYLKKHVGFANPQNVATLVNLLGINTEAPCSLLRTLQSCNYRKEEYFDSLRKKQSAKWSMETTAKGIEHFKAGEYDTAMKYLSHALQIDLENIEALVARGALCANKGEYESACKDFRQALTLNASHRNARKYLMETLIERGKMLEKDDRMLDAVQCFKEVTELDRGHTVALEHLERVQQYLASERQRKQNVTKSDSRGEVKSRFSHVRKLIKEDPSLVKKRRKKEKKKRKKKAKSGKKKKTKARNSKRSSSTESCASFGSESSSSADEWVEKPQLSEKSRMEETKSSFSFLETKTSDLRRETELHLGKEWEVHSRNLPRVGTYGTHKLPRCDASGCAVDEKGHAREQEVVLEEPRGSCYSCEQGSRDMRGRERTQTRSPSGEIRDHREHDSRSNRLSRSSRFSRSMSSSSSNSNQNTDRYKIGKKTSRSRSRSTSVKRNKRRSRSWEDKNRSRTNVCSWKTNEAEGKLKCKSRSPHHRESETSAQKRSRSRKRSSSSSSSSSSYINGSSKNRFSQLRRQNSSPDGRYSRYTKFNRNRRRSYSGSRSCSRSPSRYSKSSRNHRRSSSRSHSRNPPRYSKSSRNHRRSSSRSRSRSPSRYSKCKRNYEVASSGRGHSRSRSPQRYSKSYRSR